MGAIRKRFTPAEREVFLPGTDVEWLYVTRWVSARIDGEIETDPDGQQYVMAVYTGKTTDRISHGDRLMLCPKHVRPRTVESIDLSKR